MQIMSSLTGVFDRKTATLRVAVSANGRPVARPCADVSGDPDRHVTFTGRLDNRDDLARQLNLGPADRRNMTDASLARRAFQAWGQGCVDHLIGDWALVTWDAHTRRVTVARDQTGRTSLFYHHDAARRVLSFASTLGDLLALPGIENRVSEAGIASLEVGVPRFDETVYDGVFRLTPGHLITATASELERRQYWNIRDVADVRFASTADYHEAFREIFETSVQCRVPADDATGAFLSGGLDSSAVAVVAAAELARSGRTLQAFCAVPEHPLDATMLANRIGDESSFARDTATRACNVALELVDAADRGVVQSIRDLNDWLREPVFNAANANWYLSILERARNRGLAVLLGGEAGNITISYAGNNSEYRAAMGWWSRRQHDLALVLSRARKGLGEQMIGRVRGAAIKADQFSVLNRPFVESIRERVEFAGIRRSELTSYPSHQARLAGKYLRVGAYTNSFVIAARYGIEIRDPTFDLRLTEFCLGIPRDLYMVGTQKRLLVKTMMEGRMPDHVLHAEKRGRQSADIAQRLSAEYDSVHEAMVEIEASAMAQHYLDLGKLRTAMKKLRAPPYDKDTYTSAFVLSRGLQIGLFLRSMETG